MNSIFPKFNYPEKPGTILYHYHKVEIVPPQKTSKSLESAQLSGIDRVKNVVAGILIFLGSVMAVLSGNCDHFPNCGSLYPGNHHPGQLIDAGYCGHLNGITFVKK